MVSEDPETLILSEGVFLSEDPEIGRRVHEFERKNFPFQTEECPNFIRENIFDEARVRKAVTSCLKRPCLGFIKVLGADPHHAFSVIAPIEPTKEVKVLVAHYLSPNSEVVYFKASHRYPLKAGPASIGMLQIQKESLRNDNINNFEVKMNEGGLAIVDGRLGFTVNRGVVIMAGFTVEEELRLWAKMRLPGTTIIKQKVMEMMNGPISMNFEFVPDDTA